MSSQLVSNWFGDTFAMLHPMLQALHTHGGTLEGDVSVDVATGFAGFIGRALAKKLGVPVEGELQHLQVSIAHRDGRLYWNRRFDGTRQMNSAFTPIGNMKNGYWLENTGPLSMGLTVDVQNGGWHWRCLWIKWMKLPLPVWLFPKSQAYKTIENEQYRFYVGFSVPFFGTVLSYSGLLKPCVAEGFHG